MKYTKNEKSLTEEVYTMLQKEFDYTDSVEVTINEYDGIVVENKTGNLFMHQAKFVWEIEERIDRTFENVSISSFFKVKDDHVVIAVYCSKISARK